MSALPSENAEVTEELEADASRQTHTSSVVAVVSVVAGVDPQPTLDAVARQDYPLVEVRLIGTETEGTPSGIVMSHDLAEVVAGLDPSVEYVWVLHGDARPRPDALKALVTEANRFEASLAGSKLLVGGTLDTLESVGSATDVFGEPYTGLDEGEVDLEQYDVVRDVAFVSSVSMLVRRDLLRGLGGIDQKLAPVAAGLDLSQRVRIAGGRVIVVPSSEVFHDRRCGRGDGGWREQSGRMRAMLKAYRPITLIWMVPLAILTGVADSLISLLLGRWRLAPRYLLTWGWNLVNLPSTIAARRSIARVRQVGDEELFRYQVRGSVRLRQVGSELSDRLLTIFDDDSTVTRRAAEIWSSPTTWAIVGVLFLLLIGMRSLFLTGLPVVGHALPFGDASTALSRFVGGWNASGLGSAAPVHPVTGPTGVATLVVLGNEELARSLVTLGAFVVGIFGVGRLAQRLGVGGPGAYLGGAAALFGLPASILATDGRWSALIGIGILPWALASVVGSPAIGRRRWLGQAGLATFFTGLVACFVPVLGIAPLLFAVGLKLTGRFRPRLLVSLVGTMAAVVAVPYLVSRRDVLMDGVPIRIDAHPLIVALVAVTLLLAMIARSWRAGTIAGALTFGGLAGSHFVGPDIQEGLLAIAAVGLGLVVAAALRRGERNIFGWAGLAGGVVVFIVSLAGLAGGRGGLPPDTWGDRIGFVTLGATGVERALLIAPDPYGLPGESRPGPGFWYRLIDSRGPTLDQAILPPPGEGDDALASTVELITSGATLRPGAELAEFGVRWLVGTDQTSELIGPTLQAQIDMNTFPFAERLVVFENTVVRPVAVTEGGVPWQAAGSGFRGDPTDERVLLAYNGDPGWGPDWQPDEWAGTVSGRDGEAVYRRVGVEAVLVWAGTVISVLGLAVGIWGRRT
ncbi:MAG TPA: glycosyltransferase [Acidimicrobiia bacterium]